MATLYSVLAAWASAATASWRRMHSSVLRSAVASLVPDATVALGAWASHASATSALHGDSRTSTMASAAVLHFLATYYSPTGIHGPGAGAALPVAADSKAKQDTAAEAAAAGIGAQPLRHLGSAATSTRLEQELEAKEVYERVVLPVLATKTLAAMPAAVESGDHRTAMLAANWTSGLLRLHRALLQQCPALCTKMQDDGIVGTCDAVLQSATRKLEAQPPLNGCGRMVCGKLSSLTACHR